jgi:hypothetical protein
VILLVKGIDARLIDWSDGFCAELVDPWIPGNPPRQPRRRIVGAFHGAPDVSAALCTLSGMVTAAAIPGAGPVVVEGMGHDLPRELGPRLVSLIAGLAGSTAAC